MKKLVSALVAASMMTFALSAFADEPAPADAKAEKKAEKKADKKAEKSDKKSEKKAEGEPAPAAPATP